MFEFVIPNPKRSAFFTDLQQMSGDALFSKYYPVSLSIKFKTLIRKILLVSGYYGFSNRLVNRFNGR